MDRASAMNLAIHINYISELFLHFPAEYNFPHETIFLNSPLKSVLNGFTVQGVSKKKTDILNSSRSENTEK